jgi:DNA polymerase-1
MRLAFDLEANGFLDTVSRIHCLVLKDLDTGTLMKFRPSEVEQGLQVLMTAELMVGHNVINYDLAVIQKLYPWFSYDEDRVRDTLVLSRLIYTNLSDLDFDRKFQGAISGKLTGSHSLEAWGKRLGLLKQDYQGGFDEFTEEMLEYNAQDVEVTERLWKHIEEQSVDPRASELEHSVAFIVARQERRGVSFDTPKAEQLTAYLQARRVVLEEELQDTFKPFYLPNGKIKTYKATRRAKSKATGIVTETTEGSQAQPIALTVFNPGSRLHIAHRLKALYNWTPTEFTDNGQPKVDETVLEKLPWPEAKLLNEYFLTQKRLGMLADGDNGWLRLVTKENRIHGSVITNGAVTGRATHRSPNLAQVPSVGAPYGAECRALFKASTGFTMVGIDVSGLELRMLAHYLARWDKGSYGKIVCEGDVHTANQEAAGLPTRNAAKTFIYAFLYGAGDVKIGSIVDPLATEAVQRRKGRSLKGRFTERTPGLQSLVKGVQEAAKRGYLLGLDGRRLHIRSAHAALNTLLQSAGALVCKRWMVEVQQEINRRGWHNIVHQVLWVHDECQFEVVPEYAEEFGKVAVECIARAGAYFGVRVPLTGEYKIGANWKETH